MKKKIFVLIIAAYSLFYAQNKEIDQGIELPDFVITGVQSVDVPSITKKKAELIPVIGKQFLIPRYEPENLDLVKVDVPFYNAPKVFEDYNALNYSISLSGGLHTLPTGSLFAGANFKDILLSAELINRNILDYKDNAGSTFYSGKINAAFYNNYKSSFLPGLLIGLEGKYEKSTYKFFASPTPILERDKQNAGLKLNIDYDRDRFVNFSVSADGQYLWLPENTASNISLKSNAMMKFILPGFDLKFESEFYNNSFKDDIASKISDDFFSLNAGALFKLSSGMLIGGGIKYSSLDSNTFVFPNVSAILKINKFITISGEAGGSGGYLSYSDLMKLNRYFKPILNYSIYTENAININFSIKYEFEKYFELTGGIGFSKYNDYFYFEDDIISGFFEAHPVQDVKQIFIYGKSYFQLGPLGAFYGGIKFQQFTFNNDNYLPYQPVVNTSFDYKYKNLSKFGFGIKYVLLFDIYYDSANSSKMDNYNNLSVNLSYEVMKNMELNIDLQNILNKDNFMWNSYDEKPFDVLIGFNYKW